jgi:hypothetical protein
VGRFAERVADYRADVRTVTEDGIPSAVWSVLASIRARRVVVPDGVPHDWLVSDGVERVADSPPLSSGDLDAIDAVLTGCAIAIAETGTIVLDGGPDQGRRALTLVPDHHLCVVRADQIVDDVPAAVAALDPRGPSRGSAARRHERHRAPPRRGRPRPAPPVRAPRHRSTPALHHGAARRDGRWRTDAWRPERHVHGRLSPSDPPRLRRARHHPPRQTR